MNAYIKTLQNYDKSEIIYPVTKAGAVYLDNNSTTVQDVLQDVASKEYVDTQAENSVKKYFLIIETTKNGSDYLLDGITFDEIHEKFNAGNVNMVCHVDETDYIPLLSVTSSKIIFSGIYNSTSVALDFDTNGVGILTTTRLLTDSSLNNYYNKTEVDAFHGTLEDYVDNQVAALVNAAPETLDTLGELATAFQENKTVVDALDASITNKQDKISDTLILVDAITGSQYKIQIQNGQLVSFPVE